MRTSGEEGRVSPLARTGEDTSAFDEASTPITANTHLAAGRLAESRGDLPAAASQYRLALEKNPRHPETLYRLGVVQSRQEDPQAVETWKQYISATGGSATGLANLGFCYELLGDPAAAEAAYLRGIARDPRNTSCRVNYGMLLASRGDYQPAAAQMTHVLPPSQAWYNVGSVCERQGKTPEAITAYRIALSHDSSFAAAQKRLSALQDQLAATRPDSRPATTQSAAKRPADSR
jgi:tetratricopeptide (TPR) repeat protein